MKLQCLLSLFIVAISCNNTSGIDGRNTPSQSSMAASTATSANAGDCGDSYYFKKGAKIKSKTTDAKGKILSLQESTVDRVYNEGKMVVTEMQMTSSQGDGSKPQNMKGIYKCDGQNMIMDLSSFMENKEGMKISSTGIPFPLKLNAGEILPEVSYTVDITTNGKKMKINATIRERTVEAAAPVKVDAGTFNCYKIQATVDAIPEMEGFTEEMKKSMENARKNMPKTKMIIWYNPELAVVKMEMLMGTTLLSSTEITSISK